MKKSRESSELAARLAAAASQPAGASSPMPIVNDPAQPPSAATSTAQAISSRPKAKKPKANEPDTVPITLRPTSALWSRFVLKAAERTREEGRVVSAQQMMLEALELVES